MKLRVDVEKLRQARHFFGSQRHVLLGQLSFNFWVVNVVVVLRVTRRLDGGECTNRKEMRIVMDSNDGYETMGY